MDLIIRQDAIDAVNAYLGLSSVSRTLQSMTNIQEILEKLPSTEPEIEEKLGFLEFLWNVINPNEMEQYWSMYHCGGEEKIDG